MLRGQFKNVNFNVVQTNNYYRFIRLRQTGNSWWYIGNHNYLTICNIEFYGKLKYSVTFNSKNFKNADEKCDIL